VQARWCYTIERCLKTLRKKYRNKGKIEASIVEAYIPEEVSNFIKKYYAKNLPRVHNSPPHYNASKNESNLSLFRGQLGSTSASTTKTLTHEEWCCIMLYVLNRARSMEHRPLRPLLPLSPRSEHRARTQAFPYAHGQTLHNSGFYHSR
jgi:hypothetical protein